MPKTISVAVPEACTLCPRQCKADRAAGPANSSSSSTTFMAQGGTLASSNRSPRKRNAASYGGRRAG